MLQTILSILLILVSIALVVTIMVQQGRQAGLGSFAGQSSNTYWAKNKGRSASGILVKATRLLYICFFGLTIALLILK